MCPNCCPRAPRVFASRPAMPDLYMPAMPPLTLLTRIRRIADRRACRRQLNALLAEDERHLADLGLSRPAIRRALRRADNPCRVLAAAMSRRGVDGDRCESPACPGAGAARGPDEGGFDTRPG